MIIIKNKFIPFKGYKAINLFGILFTKDSLSNIDINHEKIHTKQMIETLFLGFYLWYGLEYLFIRLFRIKDRQKDCYHDVSFEEEAYNNQSNLDYLNTRKLFSWIKYIKIGSYDKTNT